MELAGKANDNAKGLEHLLNAFKVILIGWRHVVNRKGDPVEFRVEELADLLTMRELWELIYELLNAMRLKEDDLKNSDSRPVCASVPSAVTAPE
uniref:Uncharacterized protein n=1 Tax=viral metagenome TaxID=1070528 RepID=A0A6M3K7E6_9ZZZZ